MTTLDETKKGLDLCGHHSHSKVCHKCPFDGTMESCIAWMASDALAHIQQLEAANTELLTKVEHLEAKCHQLLTRCERLERERDALLEDIRGRCKACKHRYVSLNEEPCSICIAKHTNREIGTMFEWRGVKEE